MCHQTSILPRSTVNVQIDPFIPRYQVAITPSDIGDAEFTLGNIGGFQVRLTDTVTDSTHGGITSVTENLFFGNLDFIITNVGTDNVIVPVGLVVTITFPIDTLGTVRSQSGIGFAIIPDVASPVPLQIVFVANQVTLSFTVPQNITILPGSTLTINIRYALLVETSTVIQPPSISKFHCHQLESLPVSSSTVGVVNCATPFQITTPLEPFFENGTLVIQPTPLPIGTIVASTARVEGFTIRILDTNQVQSVSPLEHTSLHELHKPSIHGHNHHHLLSFLHNHEHHDHHNHTNQESGLFTENVFEGRLLVRIDSSPDPITLPIGTQIIITFPIIPPLTGTVVNIQSLTTLLPRGASYGIPQITVIGCSTLVLTFTLVAPLAVSADLVTSIPIADFVAVITTFSSASC